MQEQQGGDIRSVDIFLDSTLDSVDRAETEVLKSAEELGFGEEDLHKIGMAVRESMVNAVVHGNRYNARKKVHLQVYKGADRLVVVVRDQGEGFDISALPDPLAEENLLRQSGRGLLLIQAFMDELQVNRVAQDGTELRMVKYLAKAS
ncbi:MAG TPA: ATP-binding protein [Bryobacteraceae bacterium]|jgi:serine/threonine-protein kinase RsbW|nr:ATP-binding protein [Bryobacteraceae bacterium]